MVLGSVQTPKICPFVWVAERLLHDIPGKEAPLLGLLDPFGIPPNWRVFRSPTLVLYAH